MQILFIILFACLGGWKQEKLNQKNFSYHEQEDSLYKAAAMNLVVEKRHSMLLYIINGAIIRPDKIQIDAKMVDEVTVHKFPESYNKFGFIAFNGLLFLKTRQKIITTTPYEIKTTQFASLENDVLYAINGDIIQDSSIKIEKNSIIEVELLSQGTKKGRYPTYENRNCINIWTLTKSEREPIVSYGCGMSRMKRK